MAAPDLGTTRPGIRLSGRRSEEASVMSDGPPVFRRDVLTFAAADGGIHLLDLLLDRVIRLAPEQAEALRAGDRRVIDHLEHLHLFESPSIDEARLQALAARLHEPEPPPAAPPIDDIDWTDALRWPDIVAPAWKDAERLRRLAEDRAGGRRYLMLPGFLTQQAASGFAREAASLPYERFDNDVAHADKCLLHGESLRQWRTLLLSGRTRRLFGGLLGRQLPDGLLINAWRMRPGDGMRAHPDGRLYRATVSLGLSNDWRAADGGAIAFGEPREDGFVVRERWYPHAGDVCLFAPAPDTWHMVEPPMRERLTLTGWWMTR
jgi:hypothetical protein